jgi:hypothetical protein
LMSPSWPRLTSIGSTTKLRPWQSPGRVSGLTAPKRRWLSNRRRPNEHVLFAVCRQEFRTHRHAYERPSLAENRWPNHR